MIPYEELCQALDRFNGRLRNEAEMAELDQVGVAPVPAEARADDLSGFGEDEAPEAPFEELAQPVSATFASQPPESTNEISVDDIMIDEKPNKADD